MVCVAFAHFLEEPVEFIDGECHGSSLVSCVFSCVVGVFRLVPLAFPLESCSPLGLLCSVVLLVHF